jgi:hypothetical protein
MEPPFQEYEEYEDYEEYEELEAEEDAEAAANQRQFRMLVLGLGGVLVFAVLALLFVILVLRPGGGGDELSPVEQTNEAVLATNTAVVEQQIAQATGAAATGTAEQEEREIQQTNEAVEATNTAVVAQQMAQATDEAATAQARTRAARTPTPVIRPTDTPTEEAEEGTPGEEGDGTPSNGETGGTAVAQASTRTPTPRRSSGATPDTGIGGMEAILAAAMLVVVLVVARRLRLAT